MALNSGFMLKIITGNISKIQVPRLCLRPIKLESLHWHVASGVLKASNVVIIYSKFGNNM